MQTLGVTRLLELRKAQPGLLVLNHHRIGDRNCTRFDRELFSASTEEFEQQVRYLKRFFPVVGGEELAHLAHARKPLDRLYAAITFDDGYLDNYTTAFPILRAYDCPGIFFLVPAYVGSSIIPWWDAIAYLIRNSPNQSITLEIPTRLTIPLEANREPAIFRALQHYKSPDNHRTEEFMHQLEKASGCTLPQSERRFLDWEEASEMQAAGMTIGSHTATHRILSQLSETEQREELTRSRAILEQNLGRRVTVLAYPVGIRSAFTAATEQMAASNGYGTCYSFYGGFNAPATLRPTNLLRNSFEPDQLMFRNQVALMSRLGRLPY